MLTRKIDAGLDAILGCMIRTPPLLECYRPGTPEHAALAELMAALKRTDEVLFDRRARAPAAVSPGP
jgi:hypothetical protein